MYINLIVDWNTMSVCCQDNGCGIMKEEMLFVGKKCHTLKGPYPDAYNYTEQVFSSFADDPGPRQS